MILIAGAFSDHPLQAVWEAKSGINAGHESPGERKRAKENPGEARRDQESPREVRRAQESP